MRQRSIAAWANLALGFLMIVLGLYTLCQPGRILKVVVVIYGISALISGINDMVSVGRWGALTGFVPFASLITGIIGVLAGVMLILFPDAGKFVLTLLLPLWFIAHCLSRLFVTIPVKEMLSRGARIAFSLIDILGIILGVVMIFSPKLSEFAIGVVIAFYLFLLGIEHIAEAFSNLGAR